MIIENRGVSSLGGRVKDLEYLGDHIIDNKNTLIVNTKSSTVLHFNFNKMCFRENSKQTLKPIMWNNEKNEMTYWANQRWCNFSTYGCTDAVKKLHDNYFERTLLGDE